MLKSYLSEQYKLPTFSTTDLFTKREYELYEEILAAVDDLKTAEAKATEAGHTLDPEVRAQLFAVKKEKQLRLEEEIRNHDGKPRILRVSGVVDTRYLPIGADEKPIMPKGITWDTLRQTRRVAEFCSDFSRTLGITKDQITFDKVIIRWKQTDVLRQIIVDGFAIPVLQDDGVVEMKRYRFLTASAGQLRTDKCQFISLDGWMKIKKHFECGMDWDTINAHGGINAAKLLAYTALGTSATDAWPELDIDRCIVIQDFEAPVTGMMKFINPDYTEELGVRTVMINHCDGSGMMLPSVSLLNFMIRGAYLKGLLTPFDYLLFCKEHGIERPMLQDVWGQWHDLIAENIQVIFTKSQLKLWKYYDSWDQYKKCFRDCGWVFSRTNYEESYINDATLNYQFLETLVDFRDDEINRLTQKAYEKIRDIAKDSGTMLRVLRADEDSELPFRRCLSLYPAFLRDGYCRQTLRDIRRRWTFDAQSGRIVCRNKRLFVIPDMYAACEFWFLGIKEPNGLLEDGEIACRIYRMFDEADCLRSPHLSMEHAVRRISHKGEVYRWFRSNGVYTSCHDLISRVLQFDCDGDQLHVVVENIIVQAAKRNNEMFNIVPLFYDANAAPPEHIDMLMMYKAVQRAHDCSGIGQISNNLCKLWNRGSIGQDEILASDLLCYYNNQVIDGAKSGVINSYEHYPDIAKFINRIVGGKNGRMPYFFSSTKNGRHLLPNGGKRRKIRKVRMPNESTMNRIFKRFENMPSINMNLAGVPPFNVDMLLPSKPFTFNGKAVALFEELDNSGISSHIYSADEVELSEKATSLGYDFLKELIVDRMIKEYGSLEAVYPSIVLHLFGNDGIAKVSHKQMFWRVFGDIAMRVLEQNMIACRICPECGEYTPIWCETHVCKTYSSGTQLLMNCVDCGKVINRKGPRQLRCPECQKLFRQKTWRESKRRLRAG